MPQHFVRIVNRGTYTNARKAFNYVERGIAEVFLVSLSRQILEIRMLESAELLMLRSEMSRSRRDENVDDGIDRRWVSSPSGKSGNLRPAVAVNGELIRTREASASCGYGLIVTSPAGIDAKQLLPVNHVGTGRHVSKKRDELTRRQPPQRGITESLKSA